MCCKPLPSLMFGEREVGMDVWLYVGSLAQRVTGLGVFS